MTGKKVIMILGDRPFSEAYGLLNTQRKKEFRMILIEKYGIPAPTIYMFLRTNHIPLIKRNVMVDELNTILKEVGYFYRGKRTTGHDM